MTPGSPTATFELHGATTVTPTATSRAPLATRGDRIAVAAGAHAERIDLHDHLIFAGLVNAHEHLHVNAVPPLAGGAPYRNSYAWMEHFRQHFDDPAVAAARALPKAVRLRHGGLKNLLAGSTCVAHHDPWHAALDAKDFPVAVLRDYGWAYAPGWPDYGPPLRASFRATPAGWPWMIHLAEGSDAVAAAELAQLDAMGCLARNSVLVHGVGLSMEDVERVIAAGAAVIWCPSSNHALLGCSLDSSRRRRLRDAGRLALGSDSRLSGARDLLDEMHAVADRGELPPGPLLELVTSAPARILRMPDRGHLQAGAVADLVVLGDRGGDPHRALASSRRADIRAVVRDGRPRIADPDLAPWFAAAGVDTVAVTLDGRPKLLERSLADADVMALEAGLEAPNTAPPKTVATATGDHPGHPPMANAMSGRP